MGSPLEGGEGGAVPPLGDTDGTRASLPFPRLQQDWQPSLPTCLAGGREGPGTCLVGLFGSQ